MFVLYEKKSFQLHSLSNLYNRLEISQQMKYFFEDSGNALKTAASVVTRFYEFSTARCTGIYLSAVLAL